MRTTCLSVDAQAYVTLSKIDSGKGFGRWKTMPTRRRSSDRMVAGARMSTVEKHLRDAHAFDEIVHAIEQRSRVDLPHPEGPMIAVNHARLDREVHVQQSAELPIVEFNPWVCSLLAIRRSYPNCPTR